MSFRIDDAYEVRPGQWLFELQGLYGSFFFGALRTGAEGSGLEVTSDFHSELAWLRRAGLLQALPTVAGPARFSVPAHADDRTAVRLLVHALEVLGWGRGSVCPTRFPRLARKARSASPKERATAASVSR